MRFQLVVCQKIVSFNLLPMNRQYNWNKNLNVRPNNQFSEKKASLGQISFESLKHYPNLTFNQLKRVFRDLIIRTRNSHSRWNYLLDERNKIYLSLTPMKVMLMSRNATEDKTSNLSSLASLIVFFERWYTHFIDSKPLITKVEMRNWAEIHWGRQSYKISFSTSRAQ